MAIFRVDSTATGTDDGTSWTNAYPTLAAAAAAEADGSTYYVDDGHVESAGVSTTIAFSTTKSTPDIVVSVDKADDSYSRGGTIDVDVTAANLVITGHASFKGIVFSVGDGGGGHATNDLKICASDDDEQYYTDCDFILNHTAGSGTMDLGNGGCLLTWINCNVKLLDTDMFIYLGGCRFKWIGGGAMAGSSSPVSLFKSLADQSVVTCEGLDFTNFGTGFGIYSDVIGSATIHMSRCRFASGWAGTYVTDYESGCTVTLENCGDGDINHQYFKGTEAGEITDQTDIYGAGSSGGVYNTAEIPVSYKMVSSADCNPEYKYLESFVAAFYNESTSALTVTWDFIHDESAALQDDEIWMRLSYLGTSGSQLETIKDTSAFDPHGTYDPFATPANIDVSTKDWTEGLSQWQASTVYAADDKISYIGSPTVVFICTVGGTSDSSIPAGFTGASDGDSITDNTVTWHAMRRQKCSVTFTPAEQGLVKAEIIISKASQTVWIANKLEAV